MPRISIIVPVYQAEKLLPACVDRWRILNKMTACDKNSGGKTDAKKEQPLDGTVGFGYNIYRLQVWSGLMRDVRA